MKTNYFLKQAPRFGTHCVNSLTPYFKVNWKSKHLAIVDNK